LEGDEEFDGAVVGCNVVGAEVGVSVILDGALDSIIEVLSIGAIVGTVLGSPVIVGRAIEGISDLVLLGAPVVRSALGEFVEMGVSVILDGALDSIIKVVSIEAIVGTVLGSPVIIGGAIEGISDLVLLGEPVVRSTLGELVATSKAVSIETSSDSVRRDEVSMLGLMVFNGVGTADSLGRFEGDSNATVRIGIAARRKTRVAKQINCLALDMHMIDLFFVALKYLAIETV